MRADGDPFGSPRADSPEAVRFLTALLVAWPQVGSVQLTDGGSTLIMEFFLNRRLATARLREFSRELREAHEVLAYLKGVETELLKVQRGGSPRTSSSSESFESSEDLHDRADSLLVLRDLRSVMLEDLSLIIAMVEEEFKPDLVVGEDFEEEEKSYQEELMEASLERIRHASQEVDLVGFRDDLRVLVYASEEEGGRRRSTRS